MKIVMVNGAAVLIGSESPPFAARGGVQCQELIKTEINQLVTEKAAQVELNTCLVAKANPTAILPRGYLTG